jgi:diguanylate cyclase (GGDEF)-like protein
MDPHAVALAFSGVPIASPPHQVADASLAALRALSPVALRLEVPLRPVPLAIGDPPEGLVEISRFPAPNGEGRLLADPAVREWGEEAVGVIREQLSRLWAAQAERAKLELEIDQLQFHLNSLQQVARTLAVVRGRNETEKLIIDSVSEVFFAWWAVLYQSQDDEYALKGVRSLRGEAFAPMIPARMVHAITVPGQPPLIPPDDAELRDQVPAEIGVVASLDIGDGQAGVLILGRRMTEAAYEDHDLALLRALADSSAVALRNADLHDRLREQATLDPLTGCHNRRGFDEVMLAEMARARRYDRPLCLVLMDIDRFKSINDDYGHEVGDSALQRIGRAVRHHIRASDSACRFGGEEFALVFPETDKMEGINSAERLREMVEGIKPSAEIPRTITASFGVANFPGDAATVAELIRAADRALYLAKTGGRNRVECA